MRVLIVSQYFWPEEFRINDCARELQQRGHTVDVLTGIPNYPTGRVFDGYRWWQCRRETYGGVRVIRVPLLPRGRRQPWRLVVNYCSFVLAGSIGGPFHCRGNYDAILVYEPSPITVCIPAIAMRRMSRAPIFLWVQDLWPESLAATGAVRSKHLLAFVERLTRWIYRRCDVILIQSNGFRSHTHRMGKGDDAIVYLPNWAEDCYRPIVVPDDAPERLLVPRDAFVVLFAGNIGTAQGFDMIVHAATLLCDVADVHFVILGDGRDRARIEADVVQRGLSDRFHFLGRHPMEAMPRFFALADALLVTLRRDPIFASTIPGKVQSYLACGRPIIAAIDGEGSRIVTEAGAGIVCPAEDAPALANAIRQLRALPPAARAAMGACGRAYAEREFARPVLIDRLEQVLGQQRHPAA
ncbi:MAG: glycosyltransferase family 4 protein [bacterium]|nr:glycosyltransferase family 4 protein [bacterium]